MKVVTGIQRKPFLAIIHGPVGSGKTHFGTTMPDPIFIAGEEIDNIESARLAKVTNWQQFLDQLTWVLEEDHGYRTLVIDSMDSMERILERKILSENPTKTMATAYGGFGKAYQLMSEKFLSIREDYLVPIWDRGINVLLICHTAKQSIDDLLRQESYQRYELKLHKNSKGVGVSTVFSEFVMAVLMLSPDIIINRKDEKVYSESTGSRILYCNAKPFLEAKNRYNMPDTITINEGEGWNKVSPYINNFYMGIEGLKQDAIKLAKEKIKDQARLKKALSEINKCDTRSKIDKITSYLNGQDNG